MVNTIAVPVTILTGRALAKSDTSDKQVLIEGLDMPDQMYHELSQNSDVYLFPAEISNTRTDSYHTHMHNTTLRNFANEAAEGRAFLDSHDGTKLPIGYTFAGKYESKGSKQRAIAGVYMVGGIEYGGRHSMRSSDDFIAAIRARTIRDVSVGFYGGQWVCDITGRDYFKESPYYLGEAYEVEQEDGTTKMVVCTATIRDAHLSEVSAVYDGATPAAEILTARHVNSKVVPITGLNVLKARARWENGTITPTEQTYFERRYHVEMDRPHMTFIQGDRNTMDDNTTTTVADDIEVLVEEVEAETIDSDEVLDSAPAVETEEPIGVEDDAIEVEAVEVEAVEEDAPDAAIEVETAEEPIDKPRSQHVQELRAKIFELEAQLKKSKEATAELERYAAMGRVYHKDLIAATLDEGTRALGGAFDRDAYALLLATASIDTIKSIKAGFADKARDRFPGGRQVQVETVANEEPAVSPTAEPKKGIISPAAFS